MVAATEKVGAVFMTVTVATAVAWPLLASVAVTEHSITSSGKVLVPDKSNVASYW